MPTENLDFYFFILLFFANEEKRIEKVQKLGKVLVKRELNSDTAWRSSVIFVDSSHPSPPR